MPQIAYIFGAILLATIVAYQWQPWNISQSDVDPLTVSQVEISDNVAEADARETAFSNIGLRTNTAISSIPLSNVLGGGPPKDGIPAILNPGFDSVDEVSDWLDDEGLGIIYEGETVTRFYPYAILYWHEIVNDEVDSKNLAVTFCPLCGSAIIFDRGDDVFGVSGKLWESNLLMYDKNTETLWSQIIGEAVVGDRTGETLPILDANVITFAEVKERFPDAEVLNQNTGHRRSYGASPYGNYEENNSLYFPVSNSDDAFHKKELFHIVNAGEKSVGFMRADLFEAGEAEVEVDGQTVRAEVIGDSEIVVTNLATNEELPGYVAMWFSWVTHGNKQRVVWSN